MCGAPMFDYSPRGRRAHWSSTVSPCDRVLDPCSFMVFHQDAFLSGLFVPYSQPHTPFPLHDRCALPFQGWSCEVAE